MLTTFLNWFEEKIAEAFANGVRKGAERVRAIALEDHQEEDRPALNEPESNGRSRKKDKAA